MTHYLPALIEETDRAHREGLALLAAQASPGPVVPIYPTTQPHIPPPLEVDE